MLKNFPKWLVFFVRLFVGVLFIFSGFIKLNDPIGFAYKLEEYGSEAVLNVALLEKFSLELGLFIVWVEIVLGLLLLLGLIKKFTLYSLLSLTVFFTFLTFYSAYFNKVTDCGCFGDAVPLTPWQSFFKDLFLLVGIAVLFFFSAFIKPIFSQKTSYILLTISGILIGLFSFRTLSNIPVWDFRPYKVGVHLPSEMRIPENAPKPVVEYRWIFEENGKEIEVINYGKYPKINAEFKNVETKILDPGFVPSIHDFSIESQNADLTDSLLTLNKLAIVVSYNLDYFEPKSIQNFEASIKKLNAEGYTTIGLTASGDTKIDEFRTKFNIPFYFCDETALKTVIRSNPGLLLLKSGVVQAKFHWRNFESVLE